ncbi:helix-turn-helix transcriptional regulator [Enterococcus faecalis]|nr:helix-turn-helix transcriptional regulator [Enterococcus faecalis]
MSCIEKERLADNLFLSEILSTQNMLAGRWKASIIWYLKDGKRRFKEIQHRMEGISQGSLTKQLRELEKDKLIHRTIYPVVPPKVEYSLTPSGKRMLSVLETMGNFGQNHS